MKEPLSLEEQLALADRFPPPFGLEMKRRMGASRFELTRAERRDMIARFQGLDREEKIALYNGYLRTYFHGPLWPKEIRLSEAIVDCWREIGADWYHGGRVGRSVGDTLLPFSHTGARPRGKATDPERPTRVYITPHSHLAEYYASNQPGGKPGCVYRVEPRGYMDVDPPCVRLFLLLKEDPEVDDDELALLGRVAGFRCDSAKVLEVLPGPEPRLDKHVAATA